MGLKGDDVKTLQLFLIAKNAGPAAQALVKFGATGKFRALTKAALKEYQKSAGLPATGYFGPKTKKFILEKEGK